MTDAPHANAYLRTKVMSASPAELRLMLLDGAIKFACQAKEGLEDSDFERSYSGFTQCRAIVLELMTTIKTDPDPELAERVRSLYAWFYSELVDASFEKNTERVAKVIELLEYERETWVLLMEKIGAAPPRQRATGTAPTAAAPAPAHAAGISFHA